MPLLKASQMPNASPRRIICHWTAGAYTASALDRKHYHFLIEEDGKIIQGIHNVADNDSTSDGRYAAHTLRCNTKSIGVAVCCMSGATRTNPGRFPMTEVQWARMAEVAAELCRHYKIEVRPTTVLGHFEVQRNLGIGQRGKWDPGFLPWDSRVSESEVGNRFRNLVATLLEGDAGVDETPGAELNVTIQGQSVAGAISLNEDPMIPLKALVASLKWKVPYANASHAVLDMGDGRTPIYLAFELMEDGLVVDESAGEAKAIDLAVEKGFVSATAIAEEMDLPIRFNDDTDTLVIGDKPPGRRRASAGRPRLRQVVVKRGDTLSRIAAIHLDNGSRWTELRKADETPFTLDDARRLQIGQVVLVPMIADAEPEHTPGPPSVATAAVPRTSGMDLDLLIHAAQPDFRRFAIESIPVILAECLSSGVSLHAQIAYVLATSEHESGCGKWMKELWGPTPAQRGYEGHADLGNTQPGDGLRFRGRGYVQITGRRNYNQWAHRLGIDIVADPDRVAGDPSLAARILVQGMRDGTFTGKKLLDFIRPGEEPDFYNARAIVNGDKRKNGDKIAGHARSYLAALSSPIGPD